MTKTRTWLLALVATTFAAGAGARAEDSKPRLVAHEWGTFTSVAGEDGNAVPWAPLSGPSDLPCFVYRGLVLKSELAATVRMETPVLYFYAPRPMTLDVHVAFTNGQITEWYPQAWEPDGTTGGRIAWRVDAMPAGINSVAPQLPSTQGASHYFAARNTDSDTRRLPEREDDLLSRRRNLLNPDSRQVQRRWSTGNSGQC